MICPGCRLTAIVSWMLNVLGVKYWLMLSCRSTIEYIVSVAADHRCGDFRSRRILRCMLSELRLHPIKGEKIL